MEAQKNPENTHSSVPNFPKLEEEVLAFWDKEKIFEKTLDQTKSGKRFVFFEGPPTANGKPGIHHVIARTFKDVIVRYKSLRGFFVERKAGWDTHGLPVEIQVEKALKLSGKKQIEEYGIEKFNAKCRESVLQYKADWEALTKRIGFWLDMEHPYLTYTNDYIESLWWIIKQIWDKGLLYQGHKVVPHCPRCGTALSSHEVAQGYEDVKEDSVYVKFKVKGKKDTYLLSWTTTPWTLPGNVALAVADGITYVFVNQNGEQYILAKDLLKVFEGEYSVEKEIKGKDLVGLEYEQLFDIPALRSKTSHKVYAGDFVNTEEGTGIVHTAVMYGEDDYQLGEKVGLPKHHTVHRDGTFTDEVPKWAGKFVKDAEKDIIEELRSTGKLLSVVPHTHSYPFCWRCGTPLLYYAKDSWFIAMSKLRDKLIANNGQINWVPAHIKDGRFGEWLNEVKDWAFSRERYWGTPLPIWESEDGDHICVGSYDELRSRAKKPELVGKSFDPHRPYVDDIVLVKDGKEYSRVKEVIDVWFDSGAMPFAQWHYPFENKERVDGGVSFPAEYISEAIDQTRGWFYTLLAISTALGYDVPPYKNVICLGLILDDKGQKMSKSKGNVVNTGEVIARFGADPLRLFLATVNQPGEPKRFDAKALDEVVKKYFLILWNVVGFYQLYAHGMSAELTRPLSSNLLDRYIRSLTAQLINDVTVAFDAYDVFAAGRRMMDFVTELSTWYVRRSRSRAKAGGSDAEQFLSTLGYVLTVVARLSAPLTPMLSDALFRSLVKKPISVHLTSWPEFNTADTQVIAEMGIVKSIVEIGHALRAEAGIRVRQPLPQAVVVHRAMTKDFAETIADELNVRHVAFTDRPPTGSEFIKKTSNGLTVLLDTTITDELRHEGIVREVIRHINAQRKKMGLSIGDTITMNYFSTSQEMKDTFTHYVDRITHDTIATSLVPVKHEGGVSGTTSEMEIAGGKVRFGIVRS